MLITCFLFGYNKASSSKRCYKMADDLEDDEWWIEEQTEATASKKKRKQNEISEDNEENQESANESVKAKKKRKQKPARKDVAQKDIIDSSTLWNAFVASTKGKLSKMELDELKPNNMDECFLNDSIEPHISLDELSPFLKRVIPRWAKVMQSIKNHHKGMPALLILCSSARRSVEVCRAINGFKQPSCKTAKLFAKHFKLEEQQEFLSNSSIHIGIGTPNRILKLVSDDFLKLKKLKYVIFDWNYKDPKQRRMIDIPEIKRDVVGLLQQNLLPLFKEGNVKFALF